jgi:hypothetical protein
MMVIVKVCWAIFTDRLPGSYRRLKLAIGPVSALLQKK